MHDQVGYALYALAAAVVVGANVLLATSGWVAAFDAKYAKAPTTGLYILDLLISFFGDLLKDPYSALVLYQIAGIATAGSTMVIYEGRRRGAHGTLFQAAYWWGAQFIAIGGTTPFFLARLIRSPVNKRRQISFFIIAGNILGNVGTTVAAYAVLTSISTTGSMDVSAIIVGLLWPVFVISGAVVLDSSVPSKPGATVLREAMYYASFLLSIWAQWKVVETLSAPNASVGALFKGIGGNPPALFLILDLLGTLFGCLIYLFIDGVATHQMFTPTALAVLILAGPGAHLALICIQRERVLDDVLVVPEEGHKKKRS